MEYYYGQEADMFTFYRIPKLLFTDPRYKPLSTDAKLLYGLMLDRMGLSLKNKKQDAQGRTYIFFRQNEAMELLAVSKNRATKLYKELESAGLIERKRQGLTHPDIIYVGRLTPLPQQETPAAAPEVEKTEPLKSEKPTSDAAAVPESHEMGFRKRTRWDSGTPSGGILECPPVGFYLSNTYSIDTHTNESIYLSDAGGVPDVIDVANKASKGDKSAEKVYSYEEYEALFKANICYAQFQRREYPGDYTMTEVDELVALMADECAKKRPTIRAAGETIPRAAFRARMRAVSDTDISRILYKLENPSNPNQQIINRRAYLITVLYNYQSTDPTPEEAW